MELTAVNALDRTARLLNMDLFGGVLELDEIVDGLCATTARVVADAAELESVAAQHALATLVLQLAMCGIGIEIDIPEVPLLGFQPPLVGDTLKAAITAHIARTTPWVAIDRGTELVLTFLIGASSAAGSPSTIVLAGSDTGCRVGPRDLVMPTRWAGSWPVGPIAAGLAAGAEGVRAAVLVIAQRTGAIVAPMLAPGTMAINIDLGPPPLARPNIGDVPIVSAGAITHAVLYVLLRVPAVAGTVTVFDHDEGDVPSLNRYSLMSVEDLGLSKVDGLSRWSKGGLEIRPVDRPYVAGDVVSAERMLVGADDIAVRWTAQRDAPRWLGVGATSHLFAEVSTHSHDVPCVGCVHEREDGVPGVIPTISVVSGWAGLVLAADLLGAIARVAAGRRTWSFPLGLAGRHGHTVWPTTPNARCPVGCPASRARRSRSA